MTPKHIFREYDIRGLVEKELTDETSRLIGQAFGSFLLEKKKNKVAVGHDLRPSSERIHKALLEGLTGTGADVLDLGLIPTPLLYFGIVHFQTDAGISITGSHNPPEYNGFKFQLADRPFYGADIQALREAVERREKGEKGIEGRKGAKGEGRERKGKGEEEKEKERAEGGRGQEEPDRGRAERADIIEPYLDTLKKQFCYRKRRKIVIDSGHAMGAVVAPRLFKELGQEVVELYSNLDPSFPDHHPDPSVPENMQDLAHEVKKRGAALGIAFDGDMDRVGVVDEKGAIVPADRLLLIYARSILKKNPGATVVGDVKCSPLLYEDVAKRGGRPLLWKTGHSLLKAKMKESKALLGGELSGHMFFADRWYGFDDALYAACRIVEILDQEDRPLSGLYRDLPPMISTPEIRVEVRDDQKKFEIVRSVVADLKSEGSDPQGRPYKVVDLDGARIEFEDGWGLIRASNTQPVLVMRFEARSEKRLAEIRSLIEGKIKKYA